VLRALVASVARFQEEGVSDLAITASNNALALAGVDGADIDLVGLPRRAVD